jgi:hypothetical protein
MMQAWNNTDAQFLLKLADIYVLSLFLFHGKVALHLYLYQFSSLVYLLNSLVFGSEDSSDMSFDSLCRHF